MIGGSGKWPLNRISRGRSNLHKDTQAKTRRPSAAKAMPRIVRKKSDRTAAMQTSAPNIENAVATFLWARREAQFRLFSW